MISTYNCCWIGLKAASHQETSINQYFLAVILYCNLNKNIARIAKSCPKNISSVVEVSSCFLLKYVAITTFTTATVTTVTITTVTIQVFEFCDSLSF